MEKIKPENTNLRNLSQEELILKIQHLQNEGLKLIKLTTIMGNKIDQLTNSTVHLKYLFGFTDYHWEILKQIKKRGSLSRKDLLLMFADSMNTDKQIGERKIAECIKDLTEYGIIKKTYHYKNNILKGRTVEYELKVKSIWVDLEN